MNLLDVALAAAAVAALVGGARMGFLRRSLSWVGLGVGLVAGTWLVGRLITPEDVGGTREFLLSIGLVLLCIAIGQGIGLAVGNALRQEVGVGGGRVDAAFGALLGVIGLALAAWVILPSMADVSGWPARQARGSAVVGWLHSELGTPPAPLDDLPRALGLDRIPRVFEALDRAPDVQPPPADLTVDALTLTRVEASTLKVIGEGCGNRIQTGSSWVVAPGTVVTNAHVVAGTTEQRVQSATGAERRAKVVAFDPARDVAVLSVDRLEASPLATGDATEETTGAVLGYPGGGPLAVASARVEQTVEAEGRDIYDEARAVRKIHILAAQLHPGDSGGPMVDPSGAVVAMAFAVAPDRPDVAYALAMSEVRSVLTAGGGADRIGERAATSTGRCRA